MCSGHPAQIKLEKKKLSYAWETSNKKKFHYQFGWEVVVCESNLRLSAEMQQRCSRDAAGTKFGEKQLAAKLHRFSRDSQSPAALQRRNELTT
jgi:hypothetical protein